jgi:hypothetical protein
LYDLSKLASLSNFEAVELLLCLFPDPTPQPDQTSTLSAVDAALPYLDLQLLSPPTEPLQPCLPFLTGVSYAKYQSSHPNMASENISLNSGPRNRWTARQRATLFAMEAAYQNPWSDFSKIFNFIFATELSACGFPNASFQYQKIRTQFHHLLWQKEKIVHVAVNNPEYTSEIFKTLAEISTAASTLGLALFTKPSEVTTIWWPIGLRAEAESYASLSSPSLPAMPSTPLTPRDRPHPRLQQSLVDTLTPRGSPQLRSQQPSSAQQPMSIPTPPATPYRDGPSDQPLICFRAWGSGSQGVNTSKYICVGLFPDRRNIPKASDVDPRIVQVLAKTHLSRCKINSAFISVFTSPLAAVHRAYLAGHSSISVFNLSNMDQGNIFSAPDILHKDPLHPEVSTWYRGYGELLVWGEIPESCVMSSVKISELESLCANDRAISDILQLEKIKAFGRNGLPLKRQLAAANHQADYESGKVLGRLLLETCLPREHAGQLAIMFARAWQFAWQRDLSAFTKGVDSAFCSLPDITDQEILDILGTLAIGNDDGYESEGTLCDEVMKEEPENEELAEAAYESPPPTAPATTATMRLQQLQRMVTTAASHDVDPFMRQREQINARLGYKC